MPSRVSIVPALSRITLGLVAAGSVAAGSAFASEGPWTTPRGLHNVYVGTYYERFECFTLEGAIGERCGADSAPVASPVRRLGAKGFYRTGLGRNVDLALAIPVVRASSESDDESYETTRGIGTVQARLRWRMPSLGPIDLGSGVGIESGALHTATRGRITNLGDGVNAAVGTLYVGSTGLLGSRFYTASADVGYAFRFPETTSGVGRLPADEIRLASVFLYGVSQRVGVGLSLDGQFRLWGETLDFETLSAYGNESDSMRWATLNASQIKGGARLALYPTDALPYLQLSIHRSIWAENNPMDTTLIEAAVGFDLGQRRKDK